MEYDKYVMSVCDYDENFPTSSHDWYYEVSGHNGLRYNALRHCHSCRKSYILIEDESAKERRRFVWARIEEE